MPQTYLDPQQQDELVAAAAAVPPRYREEFFYAVYDGLRHDESLREAIRQALRLYRIDHSGD
jgi:hypothetical protein